MGFYRGCALDSGEDAQLCVGDTNEHGTNRTCFTSLAEQIAAELNTCYRDAMIARWWGKDGRRRWVIRREKNLARFGMRFFLHHIWSEFGWFSCTTFLTVLWISSLWQFVLFVSVRTLQISLKHRISYFQFVIDNFFYDKMTLIIGEDHLKPIQLVWTRQDESFCQRSAPGRNIHVCFTMVLSNLL